MKSYRIGQYGVGGMDTNNEGGTAANATSVIMGADPGDKEVVVQRKDYSIIKPDAYNRARLHERTRDTVVKARNVSSVPALNRRDSLRTSETKKKIYGK